MTNMKRTTISLPDELVAELERLKQMDDFKTCSYSEIIRRLVFRGLSAEAAKEEA